MVSDDSTKVVVTGCGLVSSLGLDVVNACAAARAGIVRAASVDFYPVRSSADGSVSGAVCHAVPFLTEGFEGEARLVRLLQGGLEDLAGQCPDSPWKTKRTAFYLSAPSAHRLSSGAELVADEDDRTKMLEAAKQAGDHATDSERATRLLHQGAQWANWHGQPHLKWCTESGNTGVTEAIDQASKDLRAGICELAVVGGVDSLLDEDTLGWLELTGRLKTPNLGSGLQPGEACGFLMLELGSAALGRSVRILARVGDSCVHDEFIPLLSGGASTGLAAADAIKNAVKFGQTQKEFSLWLLHDLNGELYRANEWGITLLRLASLTKPFVDPTVWFPVTCFGETGAATGAIQALVAIRAFERNYPEGESAVLASASDGTKRAVVIMSRK